LPKIEGDGKSWLRRPKLYKGVVEPYKKKKKKKRSSRGPLKSYYGPLIFRRFPLASQKLCVSPPPMVCHMAHVDIHCFRGTSCLLHQGR